MRKLLLTILLLSLTGCIRHETGTLGISSKNYEHGDIKVKVGGSLLGGVGDSNFIPEVELNKWDEVKLKVWSEEEGDAKAVQKDNKLTWKNKDKSKEYNFYEKTAQEIGSEDGGFEYEIILNEKPKSNIISLKIDTENLVYYKQKNDDYDFYNADGKTGDYTKLGGKNYKTGMAFRLYKPILIDNKKKKYDCEVEIKDDNLKIVIPDIDNSNFPAILDPTFGYTSGCPDTGQAIGGGNRLTGGPETSGSEYASLKVDSITMCTTAVGNANMKGVLVNSSFGIVEVCGAVGVTAGTRYVTSTCSGSVTISPSTTYYISAIYDSNNAQSPYGTRTGFRGYYDYSNSYSSPSAPSDKKLLGADNAQYGYVTYSEKVTASPPPESSDTVFFQ